MAIFAIHTQFVNWMRRFLILISNGPKLFVELEVSPTLGLHTLDTYLSVCCLFVCLFAGLLLQCYRFVTYGNDKLYVISCPQIECMCSFMHDVPIHFARHLVQEKYRILKLVTVTRLIIGQPFKLFERSRVWAHDLHRHDSCS